MAADGRMCPTDFIYMSRLFGLLEPACRFLLTLLGAILGGHDGVDHDVSRRLADFRGDKDARVLLSLLGLLDQLPSRKSWSRSLRQKISVRDAFMHEMPPLQARCKCCISG